MWRRQVEGTPGAVDAVVTNANSSDSWNVCIPYPTGSFVRLQVQQENQVITVSTRDKNRRIIVFAGNHDNYEYYLNHTVKMVNKSFSASTEKHEKSDLVLFDYLFTDDHRQIPF